MPSDTAQELLKLKEKIEKAKTEVARLTGQLDQLTEQRGRDFGVGSDAEADAYLAELSAEAKQLEQEISEGLQTIKEELKWE